MDTKQLLEQYSFNDSMGGNECYDALEGIIAGLDPNCPKEDQLLLSDRIWQLIQAYYNKSRSATRGKKVRLFISKTDALAMTGSIKAARETLLEEIYQQEKAKQEESRFAREVEAVNNSMSESMEELEAAIEKTIIERSSPEEIKKKILQKEIVGSVLIIVGVLFIGWLMTNVELINVFRVAAAALPITGIAIPVYYFRAVKAVHRENPEVMSIIRRSQWIWVLISVVLIILSIVLAVIVL